MMLAALFVLLTPLESPKEFGAYLARPEPKFGFQVEKRDNGLDIDLTSQTWQGIDWKHKVLLSNPGKVDKKGLAILYITGDGPRPADYADLSLIVGATGLPVATLFNVPNQPLFDGLKEDDLIAHTFQKHLETGDATWPLLFPMAKSAIKAMDAVVAATKGTDNPIERFVVAGASKRGWTTWFVGAAKDPRVVGIAPMVIDNLNVEKQMLHQLASWGKYSEQIEEYTRRGLQAQLETPKGKALARMIDPYYYLADITVPTMIITGANDPYWTVDAMSLYWNELKMPHWASITPNAGHDLGNKFQTIEAVGAFAHSLAGEFKMPELSWKLSPGADGTYILEATSERHPYQSVRLLAATSDNTDFRLSKWERIAEIGIDGNTENRSTSALRFALPAGKNVALLAEARYKIGSRNFTLSRPVTVIKKK